MPTRLRWVGIGVPVALVAVLAHLVAFSLPESIRTPPGYVATIGLVLLVALGSARIALASVDRVERRLLRQNDRLAAAAAAATALSRSDGWDAILAQVLEGVCSPMDADAGVICLRDRQTGTRATAVLGFPADLLAADGECGLPQGVTAARFVSATDPRLVDDTARDPDFAWLAERFGLRSAVRVPLTAHGSARGVLLVASRHRGHFGPEDGVLLGQIARQVGVAAHRSTLLREVLDRNEELNLVNGFSAALSDARDLPRIAGTVLRTMVQAASTERAELWLSEDGVPVLADRCGPVCTRRRRRPCAVGGMGGHSSPRPVTPRARVVRARGRRGPRLHSPSVRRGDLHGVVLLLAPGTLAPDHQRQRLLEAIADQGAVAISNARYRMRVRELAVLEERSRIAREMHDGLAQVVGYVNTKAGAIRRSLDQGARRCRRRDAGRPGGGRPGRRARRPGGRAGPASARARPVRAARGRRLLRGQVPADEWHQGRVRGCRELALACGCPRWPSCRSSA